MLKVGMFIQNRYEIISKIGSGGMADVYKAKDHKLNRFVAVKVMKKEFRDDKQFISKFRVEAQSAAGLAHANIVNIYDVGEEAGIYYIVMELVEGITLKEYIKNKGRLSVREATSIALQISAGLEAAHNNGIIHRDIKPQNIIISTDGKVKVADFGIARASSSNTINSSVMGSVHYSSPEQSRGGYSDEKSDIYSLGITMYEMLTGHVPFDGDTAVAVAIKHLQEELHGPKEEVPEIPRSTNEIVLKCTQKSPDRRYANMTEVIRDLRESLVNPDGDFVEQRVMDNTSQTIIMSKNDLEQINAEQRAMPVYDENMELGAAAGLHAKENAPQNQRSRAYQPGSYYHKSGYQEVQPNHPGNYDSSRWNQDYDEAYEENNYDPYYDAYDNPQDYKIEDESFHLQDKDLLKNLREKDRDSDAGLNPKLEKVVTIGGIIVAVVIGCVFLALLANAFGILNFGRKSAKTKKTQTQTESVVRKETEDSTEAQTEAAAKAAQQVTVPQITGLSEADAQRMLDSFGLKGVSSGTTSSTQYSARQVCSQTPAQGELVSKGDTVTYQTVQEDENIVLDDLKNYEKSMAQAFLLTKGLQCSLDESQYSDTIDAGHVISTSPEAGTTLKPGDTVTLYISQGAEPSQDPADYVTLWSVVGYTEEQATKALKMLDLEPDYQYEYSDTVAQGMVISQSVGSDEQVPRGTTVTLVISNGPAPSDTQDDAISVTNGSDGVWKCDASLETPQGYNGQQVRITLVQDGVGEATIFEGTTTFPYHLQVQGASGVSTGTAYVYLLDDNGNVTNQIEYAGIKFSQAR